jgi:hypothetical protein
MSNTKEIWKDVVGWEGIYLVSDIGNIRSLERKIASGNKSGRLIKGRIRKLLITEGKYISINLIDKANSRSTRNSVHVFVAKAFIDNPINLTEVNHKDGNKHNNKVDNLEWCTRKENVKHAKDTGLLRPRKFSEKQKLEMAEKAKSYMHLKDWQKNNKDKMKKMALSASLGQVKKVNQFNKDGVFIKQWFSIAEASRLTNATQTGISKCVKIKQETSGGFKWKYV